MRRAQKTRSKARKLLTDKLDGGVFAASVMGVILILHTCLWSAANTNSIGRAYDNSSFGRRPRILPPSFQKISN